LLLLEAGFNAVDWERLVAETERHRHTQLVVNGQQSRVFVEGTMILNYFNARLFMLFMLY